MEDVIVDRFTRQSRLRGQRTDMGQLVQGLAEQRSVASALFTKAWPHVQLADQQGCLQLGHAVVRSEHLAFELVGDAWPSAVDDRLQRLVTVETVGEDNAAFAAGHQLAFLKTE